jgi:hypothetical protein
MTSLIFGYRIFEYFVCVLVQLEFDLIDLSNLCTDSLSSKISYSKTWQKYSK